MEMDVYLVSMSWYCKELIVRKNVDMGTMQIQTKFVKNAMMHARTVQDL